MSNRPHKSLLQAIRVAALLLSLTLLTAPATTQAATLICSSCQGTPPATDLNDPAQARIRAEWAANNCTAAACYDSEAQARQSLNPPDGFTIVCIDAGNQCAGTSAQLEDPLGQVPISEIVGRFTNLLIGITGSAALLMFVWGGFRMVTSQGNDKVYASGLNSMKWAGIGLVVIFASYAALTFILNVIGSSAA